MAIIYMTLGKGMAFFHAIAELKQTVQAKILMSPIKKEGRAHQIFIQACH